MIFGVFLLIGFGVHAQNKTPIGAKADSLALDSAAIDSQALENAAKAQQLMLQQAQQSLIDSLIREKLGEEMASLNTDSKRRQELEAQLSEMAATRAGKTQTYLPVAKNGAVSAKQTRR